MTPEEQIAALADAVAEQRRQIVRLFSDIATLRAEVDVLKAAEARGEAEAHAKRPW